MLSGLANMWIFTDVKVSSFEFDHCILYGVSISGGWADCEKWLS